jgi:glutathione S-transferase
MYSAADITGFFTVRMTKVVGMDLSGSYPNVVRWFEEISAGPSFDLTG